MSELAFSLIEAGLKSKMEGINLMTILKSDERVS